MSPNMTRPDGDAKTRVDGSSDSAPLLDLSPQVRSDVDRRVAQELGVSVLAWSRMVGGAQNRLFRLDALDGPPLLTMPQNYPGRELRELVTFVVSVRSENTSSSQCLGSGRLRDRNTILLS
jgi:hypothetical protein